MSVRGWQCCKQVAGQEAERKGEAEGAQLWQRRLYFYLDRLFRSDPTAAPEFHGLQVQPAIIRSILSYGLGTHLSR